MAPFFKIQRTPCHKREFFSLNISRTRILVGPLVSRGSRPITSSWMSVWPTQMTTQNSTSMTRMIMIMMMMKPVCSPNLVGRVSHPADADNALHYCHSAFSWLRVTGVQELRILRLMKMLAYPCSLQLPLFEHILVEKTDQSHWSCTLLVSSYGWHPQ